MIRFRASGTLMGAVKVEDDGPNGLFIILVDVSHASRSEFVVSSYWDGYESWNSGRYFDNVRDALEYFSDRVSGAFSS